MDKEVNVDKLIHIYGQSQWHDDCYIVGSIEGLKMLQQAISEALENGQAVTGDHLFTSDGEGYEIRVIRFEAPWGAEWFQLPSTYVDYPESRPEEQVMAPYQLWKERVG